jgi:hypothetical protein
LFPRLLIYESGYAAHLTVCNANGQSLENENAALGVHEMIL